MNIEQEQVGLNGIGFRQFIMMNMGEGDMYWLF